MKERGIIFSGPMVRAILSGEKTQTRRVIKDAVGLPSDVLMCRDSQSPSGYAIGGGSIEDVMLRCPYGVPGDRLWVRETFRSQYKGIVAYRANGEAGAWMGSEDTASGRVWVHHGWLLGFADPNQRGHWVGATKYGPRWTPAIHMPRWSSRITLEIEAVRVERLQDITEEDASAEGVWSVWQRGVPHHYSRQCFESLWQSINGKRPGHTWLDNPWVWVISFRRVEA